MKLSARADRCYSSTLLVASLLATLALGSAQPWPPSKVPALFVFGDSRVDIGNNNYLPEPAFRANFPPYGIDFPHSIPTGRFSNGFTIGDFIAMHLGFEESPRAYLSLNRHTGNEVLRGVNFASAGSGILENPNVTTINMPEQIDNFVNVKSLLKAKLGPWEANLLVTKSLFVVVTVGNDIDAFYRQNGTSNSEETKKFTKDLVSKFRGNLKSLYKLGARKFGIIDVGPYGCWPDARVLDIDGKCAEVYNDLVTTVNNEVEYMLCNLSSELSGMKYSIGKFSTLVSNILADPQGTGYKETKNACCGGGKFNAEVECGPVATLCEDRNDFLYWDAGHVSEKAASQAADAFYKGSEEYAYPVNLKKLVEAFDPFLETLVSMS